MTDEFGGVAVANTPETDQFGGTAIKTDDFGGVAIDESTPKKESSSLIPSTGITARRAPETTQEKFIDDLSKPTPQAVEAWDAIKGAAGKATDISRSIPADVAETVAGNEPYYELKNLAAATLGEPLSIDEKLNSAAENDGVGAATVGKIAQGLAGTAPLMVVGAFPAWVQKLVAVGFTADMLKNSASSARALGEEMAKPPDERDKGKLSSALSDIAQEALFAPLAAKHGARDFIESKITPDVHVVRKLAEQLQGEMQTTPIIVKQKPIEFLADKIAPVAPLTAEALKVVAAEAPKEATIAEPKETDLEYNGGEIPRDTNTFAVPGQSLETVSQSETTNGQGTVNSGVLGDVGMGAAKPTEFKEPETISIANEKVNERRANEGNLPLLNEHPATNEATYSEAEKRIENDRDYGSKIIDELRDGTRTSVDHVEEAALVHEAVTIRNMRDAAAIEASDPNISEENRAAAHRDWLHYEDRLNELDQATKLAGQSAARVLQFRKVQIADDWTFAGIEKRARAAKGRPLTVEESAKIKEQAEQIAKNNAEIERLQKEHKAKTRENAEQAAFIESQKRALKDSEIHPVIQRIIDKISNGLENEYEAAKARLKAKLGKTTFGSGPLHELENIKDFAIIGARHIFKGAAEIGKWTAKMIGDLGEEIRPHLDVIRKASEELAESRAAAFAGKQLPEVRKVISPDDTDGQKSKIIGGMKVRVAEGDTAKDLYNYVQKLSDVFHREAIKNGTPITRDYITDKIHDVLTKELGLDIPRQFTGKEGEANAQDLISGIGRSTPLTTDPAKLAKMETREQLQKVGKINRFLQKMAAPFTGAKRKPSSAESRALEKEGREIARANGVQVTDPAKQLATSLEAKKTRLRNEIADLDRAIHLGEPIVEKSRVVPGDAETDSLQKQRDAKKAEYDATFGKPDMSDAARLKIALAAAERAQQQWADRLEKAKRGIFDESKPGRKVTSPELEAIRAQNDAAKAEVEELRSHNEVIQAEESRKSLERKSETLQKEINEKQAALDSGNVEAPNNRASRPLSPELEPLRQQVEALNKKIAEARKKPEAQKYAEQLQSQVDAINKRITEKQAKIDAEDLSSENKTKVNRPAASPELEMAKQKLAEVTAEIEKLRKDAKPRKIKEEIALATAKTRVTRQIADNLDRIARKDFSQPPPRPKIIPDDELMSKRAENAQLKKTIAQAQELERLKNRPAWQKVLEQIAGAARASALSGYHTLLKLGGYSVAKAMEIPGTEIVGAGLSKVPGLRGIFSKAHLESGSTLNAVSQFYSQMFTKGIREALRVWKTGSTESKSLYGKADYSPARWYDFFGTLHMAEKAPLVTGAEAMYRRRAIRTALEKGLDPSNEFVRAQINKEVFDYSQRAILQENNKFSEAVNGLHARLEKENPKTGQPEIENAVISTLVKTLFTKGIIRTPANYFSQTIARTPIGLLTGIGKAITANYRGIGNLTPAEANTVARMLKVGAVGSAFFVLGMIDATKKEEDRTFGGYWQTGRKQDGKDVPWGKIRIFGITFPHLVTHNPLTESAQMGSTMMRVAISKFHKKDAAEQGMIKGAVKALVGLAGKAPISSPIMRMGYSQDVGGDLVSGLVPQLLQNIAEDMDDKERAPKTTTDTIKAGIPGLRQTVPEKKKK